MPDVNATLARRVAARVTVQHGLHFLLRVAVG